MLYITLNEGEYVVINENIKIHYEKPTGGRSFMIGIDAPREVPVLRGELYEKMLIEKGQDPNAEQTKKEFVERRLKTGSRKAKKRWGENAEQKEVSHANFKH